MLRALLSVMASLAFSLAAFGDDLRTELEPHSALACAWLVNEATETIAEPLVPTAWHEELARASDVACVGDGCLDCTGMCCGSSPIRLRFSVPGWLPEFHGSTTVRGVQAPVYLTTRELFESVDDLNFVIAGRVEAEAGAWGLLADGLYVNISENRTVAGDRIDIAGGFEHSTVDAVVTYDLLHAANGGTDDASAELLAGARYWLLAADEIIVTGPRGRTVTASGRREWVDPIIGGQIAMPLTDVLLMRARADIGGFGAASDFSWNVEALGEYRCSDCCALQLGYRVLDVDYARGDGFAYDVNHRGPVATLVFAF